jgi:hypothetical protein
LIFPQDANDDIIDQSQDKRVVGEFYEAWRIFLRFRRKFERRLVFELRKRLQHQFVRLVGGTRQHETFQIRI